ncbi:LTA synthase family protein [Paenibacillus profundus]|uniref:LTA synthase family protein n=1 Tax=Paenibacillus profundus TaxID=1173085 RepID=A0ABS8YGH5_9BACL|nr:LTA synthase family protein [Paenibacillus profundus]MCE5171088.1 LTA synthase family protein [Paenibacillus profundus]
MKPTINGPVRYSNRSLRLLSLVGRLDIVWFVVLILWKLIWFDKALSIPNMAMSTSDFWVALGAVLIVGGWTLWLSARWRTLALMILNVLLTILIFSDLVYFRYFQDFISVPVLLQAAQVSSLGDSIASLIMLKDGLLFIDWIVVIPLSIVTFRMLSKERRAQSSSYILPGSSRRRPKIITRLISGIVSIAIGSLLIAVPVQQATSTWAKGLFAGHWWNASIYNVTGLLGFHGYDVYRYAKDNWFSGATISAEELAGAKQWFADHRADRQGPPVSFSKYKDSNVIIVQAEAFENFVIGKKINGQEITPHLNALLKESMYFNRFFHQTGQGRTSDADFGVNGSLHPLPTGSVFIRYPNQTYDMLPGTLKSAGYETGAYHAYDAGFWNRYLMYNNMGYDFFMSRKDYKVDEPLGWSVGDKSFLRQSVARMAEAQNPFYSFLITLTSHHPYKLPESAQQLNVDPHKDTIFGDYLQAIRYVDDAVGEMIADLKQRGLWDKTIWVLYGDHDNSIGDREPLAQFLGHDISDLDMLEMKNQVPLIVHLPDGANAGTYDTPSGQLDIAPTILHWLGIDAGDKYMMGHNLLDPNNRLVVLRNGSFTDGNVFYVPSADGLFENGTCFDYSTRQTTAVSRCEPLEAEAKHRLSISDQVITHNLIKQFRQGEN